MAPRYDEVAEGDALPELTVTVDRATLVRYAGASGDLNPIHWNERFAVEVGLPGVIAHGMLTMALGGRLVTAWAGGPGSVVEYGVLFTNPVLVPDDGTGATVEFTGKVKTKLGDGLVRVDVSARSAGRRVFGKAQAVVRLAE